MATIVVGQFFGDEGKGKVIDYLSTSADMVCRFSGGPNAGHSIYYNGAKIVLRMIPSGIFNTNVKCVLAQGMVIDLIVLSKEILNLRHKKIDLDNRLYISNKAHVITAQHIADDSANSDRIGTTKRGIGPAYADKINRVGLRINDLVNVTDNDLLWLRKIAGGNEEAAELLDAINIIKPFVTDTTYLVNTAIDSGHKVLFEGAQGTLLDIDHGSYPYVTSSNAVAGGACTGAGVGPLKIKSVIGVTKAYSTRVGEGPFPTELLGKLGDSLREAGGEYGSVTKRPRRVGWFDIPLTKYAVMVNGLDSLIVTKLDILSDLDKIKVCISYGDLDIVPYDLSNCDPKYIELEGWKSDITSITNYEDLPPNAKAYIEFIENKSGVPVKLISVGPGRDQIINRSAYIVNMHHKHSLNNSTDYLARILKKMDKLDF